MREVEASEITRDATVVNFASGQTNREELEKMIGRIEDAKKKNTDDSVKVEEMNIFPAFDNKIHVISPISRTQAWVNDVINDDIKLLSLHSEETQCITLPPHTHFTTLSNGEFIVLSFQNKVIRRVNLTGKMKDIASTKPLSPKYISKTQTDEILVSLRDDGDRYKLQPSSRRLVQRMAPTGKVLQTFEFREDGTTRLFTLPGRTAENGNANICVINHTSDDTGELIVLHENGRLHFTYNGQKNSQFDPSDVACESRRRIVVSNRNTKSIHLLSPNGTFLRYLLSDMFSTPQIIALYGGSLWIGFYDGTVKVYKYTE